MLTSHVIQIAGGVAQVARLCGVTSQAVSQWQRVPARHCLAIERATGGAVKAADMRPDVFGDADRMQKKAS